MDNLTHSLTGLMLSRAGLNRLHARATWILFFSANAPDGDAIAVLGGAEAYFVYHRWITHSIFAIPLVAILPVLLVRVLFWKRAFEWKWAYVCSVAGVASHLLLDWTNPYGIRLFLPFSDEWLALHSTSVLDVWIWAILLIATLWPMLSGLVGSEIGTRTKPGRGWAIAALLLVFVYDAGRTILHRRAIEMQEALTYNGQQARRALAFPTSFNPMAWKGAVETNSFWALHSVDLRKELDPAESRIIHKPETSQAIESARKTRLFDVFLKFSRATQWRAVPDAVLEGGTQVGAVDLWYGFSVTALVDREGRVRETSFQF